MSRWDQEWTHIYSKGWISPPSPLHRSCSQNEHLSQSTCPLLCSKRLNVSFQTLTHRRQIMQMVWRPSTWREPLIKYLIRPKQNFERGGIRHSETFFFHFRKYHNDLFIAPMWTRRCRLLKQFPGRKKKHIIFSQILYLVRAITWRRPTWLWLFDIKGFCFSPNSVINRHFP